MSDSISGFGPQLVVIPPQMREAQSLRMAAVQQALATGTIPVESMSAHQVAAHSAYYSQCGADIQGVRQCCAFPTLPPLPHLQMGGGAPGTNLMAQMFGFPGMGAGMPQMMSYPGGGCMDPTMMMMFMMMQQQQQQQLMMMFMMLFGQQQQGPANLMALLQMLQQQQGHQPQPPCQHPHPQPTPPPAPEPPCPEPAPPTPAPEPPCPEPAPPAPAPEPPCPEPAPPAPAPEPPCPEPTPEPEPVPEPQPEPQPQPERPMTLARAASILQANFDLVDTAAGMGGADGIIGKPDLEAIVGGRAPNASPELQQACRFLLDNGALFNALDVAAGSGDVDGRIGRNDLTAAIQNYAQLDSNNQVPDQMTAGRAAVILKRYFGVLDAAGGQGGLDGRIGKTDLEAVAAAPGAPPDLKAAVQFLLDNPAIFDAVDTAAGVGGRDGIIGMRDLDATIQNNSGDATRPEPQPEPEPTPDPQPEPQRPPMTVARAASILQANFDIMDTAAGQGGADGRIGKADLEAIVGGRAPNAPPELREACEYLLANPALFNAIDVADGRGDVDGIIGRNDLHEAVQNFSQFDNQTTAPQSMTLGQAAVILKRYFDLVDTASGVGGRDGIIGHGDLQAIANSPGAPPDLKAAAQFLVGNPAMFQAVDEITYQGGIWPFNNPGNRFSKEDLDEVIRRHPQDAAGGG